MLSLPIHLNPSAIQWDESWTAAGTLLTLAALLVTLWQIRREKSERSLTYSVTTTPMHEYQGVELSYEGESISNVTVVRWTVRNEGTRAIKKEDFELPLALVFGEGSVPLEVKIESERPAGLQPTISLGINRLIFVQQTLNPNNEFTAAAVIANYSGPPRLEGHVIDVPEIVDADAARRRRARSSRRVAVLGAIAAAAAVALIALVVTPERSEPGTPRRPLDLAVRAWGIGPPYRGQFQFVLGVNAYANSQTRVDVHLDRFRLLLTTLDAAHWAPPGARLSRGAAQLDYNGKRVWAVPATANGFSVINPASGLRTIPSLWSTSVLEPGQSYPARAPDGVMTFYLPEHDVFDNVPLSRVIGLAYISGTGKVLLVNEPGSWGPRRLPTEV